MSVHPGQTFAVPGPATVGRFGAGAGSGESVSYADAVRPARPIRGTPLARGLASIRFALARIRVDRLTGLAGFIVIEEARLVR
jgi:hypothetical protein